jgi:hypothetical protein
MSIDKKIGELKQEFEDMLDTAASVKGKQFVHFAKIAHASQAVMLLMDQATRMDNVDEEHWARMMDCSATVLASVISDAKAGMGITDEQASEALQYAHTLSEKMQLRLRDGA